jgi:ABC-type amino acid transport substrate-binding protein
VPRASQIPTLLAALSLASGAALAEGRPCLSPAERALESGAKVELAVGYAEAPPLVWNAQGRPQQPVGIAVDVLELLARKNGWTLRFHPFSLDDVVANVAACKLDLGIIHQVPRGLWQRQELDLTIPYLASVAAVARNRTAPVAAEDEVAAAPGTGRVGSWLASGVRALLFGLLALGSLVLLVSLVNLRMPRAPGRWPERVRFVALDPSVGGPAGALRWLRSARSGRVLVGLWVLGGIGVAFASAPPSGGGGAESRAALVTALRQSIEDVEAIGVRPGSRVVRCPDVVRCLQDLARGDLTALAGDAELICHHVRAESLNNVRFEPDLLWPHAHQYLVPPAGPLRRTLNAALGRANAQEAAAMADIRKAYGVPWIPPALSVSCPAGREAHR